ncbi:TetR/AcrR family transcriptional regulator [Salipiger aestuarii]|uniref:TetR family transcriptional regulator n=1 Tax=Salipiger aestuarii TaxID=568098 RepID=A0A327YPP2_9RHOB|nr:TetR/AcrR family transcriptional regulator [Salipiger aestuarii]EIE49140.1 TetR family transcriptional regulator [Citreicella sp. 357]KAA8613999.1 hypothetical protein AL037_04585 [Salipiger aestuarii]KAB2543705.1 hypothetical protein AL035_00590 [Salipiger aestuarii]RAK22943.1 TetR family transcriptional regulator [Salipiger aestuarii]
MAKTAKRQRMHPQARRGQILETMLALCEHQHFAAIPMRRLAADCGVNMALLYHYFDSKEALVLAALRHAIDDFIVLFEDLTVDDTAPLGAADAWFQANIDAAPRLVRMVKLMNDFASDGHRDPKASAMVDEFYARERDTLRDAIQRGIAEGRFRALDADRTARLTSIAFDGIFFGGPARGDYDFAGNLRDLRDHLLATLAP